MKGTDDQTVEERFQPTEEDEHSVVIVEWDTMKAPTDEDYIRAPYRFDSLDDVHPLPEKPGYSRDVIHQDGRRWSMTDLREDPPEWFRSADE